MRSSSYLSTSQTAQMLGLSVGTVQRMVESGALQAYSTQGGHRRILASSIRDYCQHRGVPTLHTLVSPPGACIIHHTGMSSLLRQSLEAMPQLQLVSHPLELAGIGDDCPTFFVDAHVSWLDWPDLHRPKSLSPTARFIVYNSADLTAEQRQSLSRHAQLYDADISAELMTGFLLASGTLENAVLYTTEPH